MPPTPLRPTATPEPLGVDDVDGGRALAEGSREERDVDGARGTGRQLDLAERIERATVLGQPEEVVGAGTRENEIGDGVGGHAVVRQGERLRADDVAQRRLAEGQAGGCHAERHR